MSKNKNGITLIALVITIIVLLILAGISISMLSGENSILSKASEAKVQTENKSQEEQIKLEIMGSIKTDGKIDAAKLKTNLEKIGATVSGNSLPMTVTIDESTYKINTNGAIENSEPLTLAKALEYVENNDIDSSRSSNQTFDGNPKKLKLIGDVSCPDPGGEQYFGRTYYRYSGDGNVYYIKYDNNEPVSLEMADIDATITKNNNDEPILLTNSYGEYTSGNSPQGGKFVYSSNKYEIYFPEETSFTLEYNEDGLAFNLYYRD